jgi:hypothetical protein
MCGARQNLRQVLQPDIGFVVLKAQTVISEGTQK